MGQYAKYEEKRDMPQFRMQMKYLPVGFNYGQTTLQRRFPTENYYKDIKLVSVRRIQVKFMALINFNAFIFRHKRQYPPLSLHSLQLMIDTQVVDPSEPIDLGTICGTNFYKLDPLDNCYGIHLTDDGIDEFKSKLNIEVQHASEQVIAAIEKNGGTITTSYYDISSVMALCNPKRFFEKGA